MPTVPTRRNAGRRAALPNHPRTWNPLAQMTAFALLALLAVFLVSGA